MMNLDYFCSPQSQEKEAITSADEAEHLKRSRWSAAERLGIPGRLVLIAEMLGHDPASIDDQGNPTGCVSRYGPKRRVKLDDVSLYWDGYGGFSSVYIGREQVYSSHDTSKLIIRGTWLKSLLALYDEAVRVSQERKQAAEQARLERAMKQI
jgi:hypothetical protein